MYKIFKIVFRCELLAAQNENFQLEKQFHELQMTVQYPPMSNRLSETVNGSSTLRFSSGLSAPTTPNVVRKYYEMKYGDKGLTSNLLTTSVNSLSLSMYNNMPNFDAGQATMHPLSTRTGNLSSRSPASSIPQPNIIFGARNSSSFNLRSKLPNSIQNSITNTSQSLQSKLPATLQKLPASLTERATINMLASKLQNVFS